MQHIDSIISKIRAATFALLTLKRHGIEENHLIRFYKSRILSIITYASPSWYPFVSQQCQDKLERIQKRCLRIIYPDHELSYTDRIERSKLPPINLYMNEMCLCYTRKIIHNSNHRLHKMLPQRQSQSRRHSARLDDKFIVYAKTKIGSNSLFSKFLNA